MSERFMPEANAVAFHLGPLVPTGDGLVFSSFRALLRNARKHTGRSEETGEVDDPTAVADWLGALGYLVLLEQIGRCFSIAGQPRQKHEPVASALVNFGGVRRQEARALYALRCALAHDFGLQNRNEKKRDLQHQFRLIAVPGGPLVRLPAEIWSGNRSDRTHVTDVNLYELAEVSERVAKDVIDKGRNGCLELILDGGSDELLDRYSMGSWQRVPPDAT